MPTTRVLLEEAGDVDPAFPFNRVVEVELPDGYYRVWDGALKPGDLYLSRLAALDGRTVWEPITEFPTEREAKRGDPGSSAGWYECVVRKGVEVVPPCDRCGVNGRERGLRFCRLCAVIMGERHGR
jgi:hypothetical protein